MSAIIPHIMQNVKMKRPSASLPCTKILLAHSTGTWGSDVAVVRRRSALDASPYRWDVCEGGREEGEGDEDSLDENHFVCLDFWVQKRLGMARRLRMLAGVEQR